MDNFTNKILHDYFARRDPFNTIIEYSDNSIHKVLLEAATVAVFIQATAAQELLKDPISELWGMENIEDWENLNNNQKINEMFKYWSEVGASAKAREYLDKHPLAEPLSDNKWVYDIKDIETPYDGEKDKHYQELKKSEVFKGLVELFANYLERQIEKARQ